MRPRLAGNLVATVLSGLLGCGARSALEQHVPCTPTTAQEAGKLGLMVLCEADPDRPPVTQCEAEGSLCNERVGWRLCPARTYVAYGTQAGALSPPQGAWIGACVRWSGGAPQAPTEARCPSCAPEQSTSTDVAWNCGTGGLAHTSVWRDIGIVSHDTQCRRVGVDHVSTEGLWMAAGASKKRRRALCCWNQ